MKQPVNRPLQLGFLTVFLVVFMAAPNTKQESPRLIRSAQVVTTKSSTPTVPTITVSNMSPYVGKRTETLWKHKKWKAADPAYGTQPKYQPCARPTMPLLPLQSGDLDNQLVIVCFGHGAVPGDGMSWVEIINGEPFRFYESAYTYVRGMQLVYFLRMRGATVYLTTWSDISAEAALGPQSPDVPLPLPRDAVFVDPLIPGRVRVTREGWHYRTDYANRLYKEFGRRMVVTYIAVHVNDMSGDGYGGTLIVVKDKDHPCLLATLLKGKIVSPPPIEENGQLTTPVYRFRQYDKKIQKDVDKDVLIGNDRGLFLFNHSIIPNTIIWEMGTPQDAGDSLRIRDKEKSAEFIKDVAVAAVEDFAKETTR